MLHTYKLTLADFTRYGRTRKTGSTGVHMYKLPSAERNITMKSLTVNIMINYQNNANIEIVFS